MNLRYLLIIILFNSNVFGQERFETKGETYTVIATSGLNLREAPNINSNKIRALNYGDKVRKIDLDINVTSEWIKVISGNFQGFMLKKYLAPYNFNFPTPKINHEFAIIFPVCTCYDNFQFDSDLNWFGIYNVSDGKFEAKKTNYSYYHREAEIGTEICIETNSKYNPEFIIGTKEQISIRKTILYNPSPRKNSKLNELINHQMYFHEDSNKLIYCYENRDIDLTEENMAPKTVIWRGDLNNDDINDFIIEYGEKSAKFILVLSDNTKNQTKFLKVAEFYFGYCC